MKIQYYLWYKMFSFLIAYNKYFFKNSFFDLWSVLKTFFQFVFHNSYYYGNKFLEFKHILKSYQFIFFTTSLSKIFKIWKVLSRLIALLSPMSEVRIDRVIAVFTFLCNVKQFFHHIKATKVRLFNTNDEPILLMVVTTVLFLT